MNDKIQEIRITSETARKALYEIDGPIASDEGMIIENALTIWEEERAQLDGAKLEAKLERELSDNIVAEREQLIIELDAANEKANIFEKYWLQERELAKGQKEVLRQQLDAAKQENERLKLLIREETSPHTAPASGSAVSVGPMKKTKE